MKRTLRWTMPMLLAILVPAAASAAKRADVEITNRSDWDIHHFFLSSTDDDQWGPDQLGDEVIESGESFTLLAIPCDDYDVRLIDEDGDECVIGAVDICGKSQAWVITSKDLLQCEAATED